MPMYWETTPASGNWRLTTDLWVWNGSAWLPVKSAWIWTGAAWELCHVAPTTLDSFTLYNSAAFCDATVGNFRATWSYTSGDIASWTISLDYSLNYGSTYTTFASGIDPTTLQYDGTMDGIPGFSSLNATYFRLRLVQGGVDATNSPRYAYPTFPCL